MGQAHQRLFFPIVTDVARLKRMGDELREERASRGEREEKRRAIMVKPLIYIS